MRPTVDLKDGRRLVLSRHAEERRVQMGLSRATLAAVVSDPERSYPQKGYGSDARTCHQGRTVAVVTVPQRSGDLLAVTVLWTRQEGDPRWTR